MIDRCPVQRRDGRIVFNYDTAQLTSKAMVGLSPGGALNAPAAINFSGPPASVLNSAFAEFFTLEPGIDELAAANLTAIRVWPTGPKGNTGRM